MTMTAENKATPRPYMSQIKLPCRLANAAQGPVGILDSSGKAVAWFSDSCMPANGYVWKPESKHVPDPDGCGGTTCYSERNQFIRSMLEQINGKAKTDSHVAALKMAREELASPLASHDAAAERANFMRCGCEYCQVARKTIAAIDEALKQ